MADEAAAPWCAGLPAGMTGNLLSKIATHDAPAEFRAAALDAEGRVWRLFQQRWAGAFDHAHVGDVLAARLRRTDRTQGGTFAELDSGEQVLISGRLPDGLSEGAAVRVRIVAEQRRGKLSRAVVTDALVERIDPFQTWKASLPASCSLSEIEDPSVVELAFDAALEPTVTLPGGGQVHIERTRALTAIDVDTSGRQGRGSAGARALSINREAATEAARQCALRDLGGAIVLDCVAPLNQSANAMITKAFQSAFQSASTRQIEVIAPSKLGLLQAAIAWGAAPLEDRLLNANGELTPETRLLSLLRQVEREASANGAALFRIDLSSAVFEAYVSRRERCNDVLMDRFGGRVQAARGTDDTDAVRMR